MVPSHYNPNPLANRNQPSTADRQLNFIMTLGLDVHKIRVNTDSMKLTLEQIARCVCSPLQNTQTIITKASDHVKKNSDTELTQRVKATNYIVSEARQLFAFLGQVADKWSAASNRMIQNTGNSGDAVRDQRSDFTDMISALNKETGYAYNALSSYERVMEMTRGVTGDLDAIAEMSRPLLLADQSMPGDIASISELFNKFYVRYGFSSNNMESVLDQIRGNTAGNAASEEDTIKALNDLQTIMELTAGPDSSRQEEFMKNLSDAVSYMGSMNIDPTSFTDYVNKLYYGDFDSSMLGIMNAGGSDPFKELSKLASGDLGSILEVYLQGYASRAGTATNNYSNINKGAALDAYTLDRETAGNIYAALNSPGFKTLEEFLSEASNGPTMAETVEDKYYGLFDKINNQVSTATEYLADIQEKLGVGWSDTSKVLGGILAVLASSKMLSSVGSLFGAGGSAGAGLLTKVLPAIGGFLVSPAGIATVAGVLATGLIVAAVKDKTALSGNAKDVEESLSTLEESFKQENKDRLSNISDLNYQFSQESDVSKRRELMLESGIFTEDELNKTSDENLQKLINSYRDAALAMDTTTEGLLKTAEHYYQDSQNIEQKDFISQLRNSDLSSTQMKDVLNILAMGVTDEDLLDKIAGFKGTKSSFNDILYGGKNAWFDSNNLQDKSVDTLAMQYASDYLGWNNTFTSSANMDKVTSLFYNFLSANNAEARTLAWDAIENSGLKDEVMRVYGSQIEAINRGEHAYADGTNSVSYTQRALIHEGEEIVPKKYNFANSSAGILKDAIAEVTDRQVATQTDAFDSLASELKEILTLLNAWKKDNEMRERLASARSRSTLGSEVLRTYGSGYVY